MAKAVRYTEYINKYNGSLPASISPGDYPTAQELLDALTATARAQGKDRFFSYLTTPGADSSFLQEGQFIGFGFRTSIQANRLLLPDVYEGSPAAQGGLERGTEITAVDSGSGYVPMATILATDPNLEQAFGPATEGVQRGLRFVPPGSLPMEAVFTKRVVTIPPVPANGTAVLTMPSGPTEVGYINLRTFISTAETPLRTPSKHPTAMKIQLSMSLFTSDKAYVFSLALNEKYNQHDYELEAKFPNKEMARQFMRHGRITCHTAQCPHHKFWSETKKTNRKSLSVLAVHILSSLSTEN